ncbi:hypothetical protein [Empedobacter brevis]|uniref:hypothetical protein n=1 Tax=Empedobacter brevis TaxID=247 RepID=UPI0039B0FF64
MLNKLLILATIFITSNLFAQIYRLEYKFEDNIPMVGNTIYNASLDYNTKTKESIYTVFKKNKKTELSTQNNAIMLDDETIDNVIIYNNFKDSLTITQDQVDIEMLLFKEKTPKIKWNLTKDTKIKNNLN